jgi:hypothetical protein
MRVERRGAVRAHDAQVLDPVVIADAVHVIEDQGHSAPAPHLALAAQLALARFEARAVQPLLQMAARERRALDEDLVERPFGRAGPGERSPARGVPIEVLDGYAPHLDRVALQRSPVVAARAHAEMTQRLRVRP